MQIKNKEAPFAWAYRIIQPLLRSWQIIIAELKANSVFGQ